jgi:hypothetical protein
MEVSDNIWLEKCSNICQNLTKITFEFKRYQINLILLSFLITKFISNRKCFLNS